MTFYQLVAWRQWLLELYDASSAYLQAEGRQEVQNIYTYGVPEMSAAIGIPVTDPMCILKAWYGLADAPRCFWLDADGKIINKAGGIKVC